MSAKRSCYAYMVHTLLRTHEVAYSSATEQLFSQVSLSILPHDRIALLGKNGSGKSTLLKILAHELVPDTGTVITNGVVSYVPQVQSTTQKEETVHTFLKQWHTSYDVFVETYRSIFSSLPPAASAVLGTLSGGEYTKVVLVATSIAIPDVLLLDEPTNHLDTTSLVELERWVAAYPGAVVFVSHNRSFVSHAATRVWEVIDHSVVSHTGTYDTFVLYKEQQRLAEARRYEAKTKELRRLAVGEMRREQRAERARQTHRKRQRDDVRNKMAENYFKNKSEVSLGRIKKKHDAKRIVLETEQAALRPEKRKTINLPLVGVGGGRRLLLAVDELSVSVGERRLLSEVMLRIAYGDRIAIGGDNGSGKTKLLQTLMREIENPTMGTSRVGVNVSVAYVDQRYESIAYDKTVFENIADVMESTDSEHVYKQLGRFQFPLTYAHIPARTLSGGEVARLAFAIVTAKPLDLLLLDEPTNNLDMSTVDIIVEALESFTGALLVVSHDQSFVDALRVEDHYMVIDRSLKER